MDVKFDRSNFHGTVGAAVRCLWPWHPCQALLFLATLDQASHGPGQPVTQVTDVLKCPSEISPQERLAWLTTELSARELSAVSTTTKLSARELSAVSLQQSSRQESYLQCHYNKALGKSYLQCHYNRILGKRVICSVTTTKLSARGLSAVSLWFANN
jgi:hypothetical protein